MRIFFQEKLHIGERLSGALAGLIMAIPLILTFVICLILVFCV